MRAQAARRAVALLLASRRAEDAEHEDAGQAQDQNGRERHQHFRPDLDFTAKTAASTRFFRPSLLRMRETWFLTVFGLITSACAISVFSLARRDEPENVELSRSESP